MKKIIASAVVVIGLMLPTGAMASGMLKVESPYTVTVTLDRLTGVMEAKGITIFARIDHAAGAKSIGEEMPPSELMLFGNPKLGTPLMKINPEVAFDLPLKALAWQDGDGKVWLAVTNPAELNQVYSLAGANGVIEKMTGAIKAITGKALEQQ
ncbi:MAG: DUF302 domain-containing protein [Hyphomicrobiales bacterium]|nr:DUF302 domain-containing protein [Hyphomicrobiales bacterium]